MTTEERDELDKDVREWYDRLQTDKAANPPKRREITVETTHTVETQKIPAPEDELIVTSIPPTTP
jgi:hypothetical protein